MKKIDVKPGRNSYNIYTGAVILAQTGEKLKELGLKDKAVIITNPTVNKLYGAMVQPSLIEAGFKTTKLAVPDGEEYKTLESAGKLYEQLAEWARNVRRSSSRWAAGSSATWRVL